MGKETKEQRYKRKLTEAGLKRVEVWVMKDEEKAVRAYDRRAQMHTEIKKGNV